MNHPFTDRHLPYNWEYVQEYWPQRLIHVPTMTSIPRDENNVYRTTDIEAIKPTYNILSYTWGRWRIRDDSSAPAIPVKGTYWPIPPVKEEHFTVDTFQKVIRAVAGSDAQWIWVDVGCIDQRNNEQSALEVGRQASIFKQAQSPFVWISHLHTTELTRAIQDAQTYGLMLRECIDRPRAPLNLVPIVDQLKQALDYIFNDPWFSSLWTLQEVVLRNDAVILSAEGDPIVWEQEPRLQYTYLTMFINHCQNVYQDLEILEQRVSDAASRYTNGADDMMLGSLREMREQILKAGFYYLFSDNPNVQYGTARHRQTSRPTDRVYAIMQVYNIQVGKSARPNENPGLEELVDEFAAAINARSAILGQFFLHTAPPKPGKTWRITEDSMVPDALMDFKQPHNLCTMVDDAGDRLKPARATGKCCAFADLLKVSIKVGDREGLTQGTLNHGWGLHLDVLFDSHIRGFTTDKPPSYPPRITDLRVLGTEGSGSADIDVGNICVLLLGDVRGTWHTRRKAFERKNVGLILHPTKELDEGNWQSLPYERLGVCLWTTAEDWHSELLRKEVHWDEVQGLGLQ